MTAQTMRPIIPDWSDARRPPDEMVPALNALWYSDERVITLADIKAVSNGIPADKIAKILRECRWLDPLRTRGAWRPARWYCYKTSGFVELAARLKTHPDTGATIAGRSAMAVHEWLKRPTAPTIGMAPDSLVPQCLSDYEILRWVPRTPVDVVEDLPVWSPAILVAYMATWPAKFCFADAGEWLPTLCKGVDLEALREELNGRPLPVWMKAAFVLWRGGDHGAANLIARSAPRGGKGPYKFGVRTKRWGGKLYPEFDVVDYIFVSWWIDPSEHFIQWDTPTNQTTPNMKII